LSGTSNGGGNSFIVEQPYLRPVESQKYLKLNSDRSYGNNNNGTMANNQTQYPNGFNNNKFNNNTIYNNPSRLPTQPQQPQQPYS